MYCSVEQEQALSQGAIIKDVVFAYIPKLSNPDILLHGDNIAIDLAQPFDPETEPLLRVVAEPHKSHVLVLTQSCDIDNKPFICVARVFPLSASNDYARIKSEKDRASFLKNNYQRAAARPAEFYLMGAGPDFPKSWASFLELHTIRKSHENVEYLKRNRILQLNKEATDDLQFRIAYFFGRYAGITDNYMLTDEEKRLLSS